MAAAIVQQTSVQGVSTTSVALAFPGNVTAGNAIVVCCGMFGTAGFTTGGCADTRSSVYTRDVSNFDGAHSIGIAIYSAPNITGGACTVTVSGLPSASFPSIAIYEVSGMPSSGIFDKGAVNNATSGTSHATGTTGTAAQATGIVFAVDTHGGGTSTPTVAVPYNIAQIQTNSSNQPLGTAYRITTVAAAETATFTWENAVWVAGIGIYKDTGGGGAVTDDRDRTELRGVMRGSF